MHLGLIVACQDCNVDNVLRYAKSYVVADEHSLLSVRCWNRNLRQQTLLNEQILSWIDIFFACRLCELPDDNLHVLSPRRFSPRRDLALDDIVEHCTDIVIVIDNEHWSDELLQHLTRGLMDFTGELVLHKLSK